MNNLLVMLRSFSDTLGVPLGLLAVAIAMLNVGWRLRSKLADLLAGIQVEMGETRSEFSHSIEELSGRLRLLGEDMRDIGRQVKRNTADIGKLDGEKLDRGEYEARRE